MTMTAEPDSNVTPLKPPRGRNVVAVASGKGGVGKTWFAITLAQALAQSGQSTLLFDGDLGLANVDIQLGLMPRYDLASVIAGKMKMARATTTYETGGFDILAGRSGSGNLASLPPARLAALRNGLIEIGPDYDRVVVDLGAGLDRAVRLLADHAGLCLVVTTPEPTALTDAYAFIKVCVTADRSIDIRVVVNQVASRREGQATYDKLHKVCHGFLKYGPHLAGIIRRDPKVPDAIRSQIPLLTRHPGSAAAEDVRTIARALSGDAFAED